MPTMALDSKSEALLYVQEIVRSYDHLNGHQQAIAIKLVTREKDFEHDVHYLTHSLCTFMETKIRERESTQ